MKFLSLLNLTLILFFAVSCNDNKKNTATLKIKEPAVNLESKEKEKRDYEERLKQEKSQREEEQKEKELIELQKNNAIGEKLISQVYKNNSNGLITYLKFETAEGYSGRLGALTLTNSNSNCKYVFSYNVNGNEIQTVFVNSTCGAKSSDMKYIFDDLSKSLSCMINGRKFVFTPTTIAETAVKQKPQPYFGTKTYGDPFITFSQLRTWNSLTLKTTEPSNGVQYQIISYSFSIRSGNKYLDIPTAGNRLLSSAKDLINKAKVSDKVYFSNITIRGTDGKTERLGDLNFQITQ
jgi:hypothetical protein